MRSITHRGLAEMWVRVKGNTVQKDLIVYYILYIIFFFVYLLPFRVNKDVYWKPTELSGTYTSKVRGFLGCSKSAPRGPSLSLGRQHRPTKSVVILYDDRPYRQIVSWLTCGLLSPQNSQFFSGPVPTCD